MTARRSEKLYDAEDGLQTAITRSNRWVTEEVPIGDIIPNGQPVLAETGETFDEVAARRGAENSTFEDWDIV